METGNMWEHGNDQNNPAHKRKTSNAVSVEKHKKLPNNCRRLEKLARRMPKKSEAEKEKRGIKTKNQPQTFVLQVERKTVANCRCAVKTDVDWAAAAVVDWVGNCFEELMLANIAQAEEILTALY